MKTFLLLLILCLKASFILSSSAVDTEYIQYMDDTDAKIDAFLDFIHLETILFLIKQILILYFCYYMLKKGSLLKKSFEISLKSLFSTALFFGILITYFISTEGYPYTIEDWLWFLLTKFIIFLGFIIGWKSLSNSSCHIKNAADSLVTIHGNNYYYYAFQGFWIALLFRIYIVYTCLPTMKIMFIYPVIFLAYLLTGMFWARFFYAYQKYRKTINLNS